MWQTDFKLAQRHVPVLAKIKPTTIIDGGYRIGYIHTDHGVLSLQLSSDTLPLERVERWISLNDLERIVESHSCASSREDMLRTMVDKLKAEGEIKTDIKGNLIYPKPNVDHALISSILGSEYCDQPTLRPMREGIENYELGGES